MTQRISFCSNDWLRRIHYTRDDGRYDPECGNYGKFWDLIIACDWPDTHQVFRAKWPLGQPITLLVACNPEKEYACCYDDPAKYPFRICMYSTDDGETYHVLQNCVRTATESDHVIGKGFRQC